jgi:drug/metabolite transporter (DMT)-like permease
MTALDAALYAGLVLSWGFSWLGVHYQIGVVSPEVSLVWRFGLAAPLMLAIAAMRGETLRYGLRQHGIFMLFGFFLFSMNFLLFYYGNYYLASGLFAVIFSLTSIINVAMGALILHTPVDRRVVIGALLGAGGVAAMFYPELVKTHLDRDALIGLALGVVGTLVFCCGSTLSSFSQKRGLPVLASSGWGMLYGCAIVAILAAVQSKPFIIEPTIVYIGALIYLAVIASVLAFACYLILLGRIGAARAGYATVMFPVIALCASTLAEGYRWTIPALLGLLAVLAGNLLVLRMPRRG